MRKTLYFVEVGVLLTKTAHEFEEYKIRGFYDDVYGFYDENVATFTTYNKAKKYADTYVNNGNLNTYGFIQSANCNITDEQLEEIKTNAYYEYSLEPPVAEDIEYFTYKTQYNLINTLIDKRSEIK